MTTLEFRNTEFRVRSLKVASETWFVARDICRAVGVRSFREAVSKLDDDEWQEVSILSAESCPIVSESGMYALVHQSRKPQARAFRRWVSSEVIPALRSHGNYQMTNVDPERVAEVKASVEGAKKKLAQKLSHLFKVQEVEGNVSLKAYLAAAHISLEPKMCMRLGARCNYRSGVFKRPIGKLQQRRGRTQKLSDGHCRHGWHLVSTFAPSIIAVELRGLGYQHDQPDEARLNEVMKSLVPTGHRLNPATPTVSLY